jgi:hypothetical protein
VQQVVSPDEEWLSQIQSLHEKGLINEQYFTPRKQEILNSN